MKYSLAQGISALIVSIAALIGYGVCYNLVIAKSAEVASLENEITQKSGDASRIAAAQVALAEISGDEAAVQNYFVSQAAIVGFNDGLEALGRTFGSNVTILSESAGATSVQPIFTFALTIKGTFDAVMRTVGAIEYSPYDLTISTLGIGQDGAASWHANMNLVVGAVSGTAATSTP